MKLLKTRTKAFLIHFSLSIIVVTFTTGFFTLYFFPEPFLSIDSIVPALKILIAVDLTLGPALTFLIYVPEKRGLFFDLCFIATLQLSALLYGLWAIYDSRPTYLVFYADTFYIADRHHARQDNISDTNLAVNWFSRPKIVTSILPGTTAEKFTLAINSINKGAPVQFNAEYFHPFKETSVDDLKRYSVEPGEIKKLASPTTLKALHFHIDDPNLIFIRVLAHQMQKIAVVNITRKEIIDILDIKEASSNQ